MIGPGWTPRKESESSMDLATARTIIRNVKNQLKKWSDEEIQQEHGAESAILAAAEQLKTFATQMEWDAETGQPL
jgi:hypothetical protein